MAENLFVGTHKSTNKKFREGYDRTFKRERDTTCYCTLEEHDDLFEHEVLTCPRCGCPTDPRILPKDNE